MPNPCRACASVNRPFIDGSLRDGVLTYREIVDELARRGEKFASANISRHKPHVQQDNDVPDEDLAVTIEQLRDESKNVPPTLRMPYLVLIHFLESYSNRKAPTISEALSAARAITDIGGMNAGNAFLLAYAEKAFRPGRALDPNREWQEPEQE